MPRETAHILWNTDAGSASMQEELATRLSNEPGARVIHTASLDEAIAATREAVVHRIPRIIAAGGDGTVNAVASTILDAGVKDSALGVLPLGTGNDLARSLGMSLNPLDALVEVLDGEIVPIDVLSGTQGSERRWIFNMATAGNTGRFVESVTEEIKQRWGVLSYIRTGVQAVRDLTVYDIEFDADDGVPQRVRALNVFLANGRSSGGGVQVAPTAKLDDGVFDYVIVLEGSAGELTSLVADYAFDRLLENNLILAGKASRLRMSAAPALRFSMDGDVVEGGDGEPVTFELHRSLLPAIVGPAPLLNRSELRSEEVPSLDNLIHAVPMLGVM